eukprot:1186766-Prorocentrum_minimum.AAC.1
MRICPHFLCLIVRRPVALPLCLASAPPSRFRTPLRSPSTLGSPHRGQHPSYGGRAGGPPRDTRSCTPDGVGPADGPAARLLRLTPARSPLAAWAPPRKRRPTALARRWKSQAA